MTVCSFEGIITSVFLDSSMAEHSAVNRRVVGSSPTRGVKKRKPAMNKLPFSNVWLLGQVVKTSPSHGENMGSNPVGVNKDMPMWLNWQSS